MSASFDAKMQTQPGVFKRSNCKKEKYRLGLSLVSLVNYLARLKPLKWPRDETSLVVSNLGCSHYLVPFFYKEV